MAYQASPALRDIISGGNPIDSGIQKPNMEIAITPDELRQASFSKSMRGYNTFAVDSVIQRAALAIEELMLQRQEIDRLTRDGAESNRLRADIRAAEQKLSASENENAGLRSQIEGLKRQNASLRQELSEVNTKASPDDALMAQVFELEGQVEALKNENLAIVKQHAEAQQALDESRTAAAEAAAALKELQDFQGSLQAPVSSSLVDDLQKTINLIESAVLNAKEIFAFEAESVLGAARAQADNIKISAEKDASAVLAEAKEQSERMRAEAISLREKAEQRVREYRDVLESHLRAVSMG